MREDQSSSFMETTASVFKDLRGESRGRVTSMMKSLSPLTPRPPQTHILDEKNKSQRKKLSQRRTICK